MHEEWGGLCRRLLELGCLVIWIAGCSGDGGGGSSPTEPSAPVSIQGTWVGTASSLSASGTCLADNFGPLTVPARLVFQQTGSTFTGTQTLNNVVTCPIQGSVRGSSVTLSPTTGGAPFCTVQSIACSSAPQRPLRMELRLDRSNLTGTVNGDRLTASGTSVWHVTDAGTGQSLGDYEVRSSQDLRKQ